MAKPAQVPSWASDVSAPIVEPTEAQKASGWAPAQKPPAQYFNWWMNRVYQWCAWLNGLTNEALTWAAVHTFQARAQFEDGLKALGPPTDGLPTVIVETDSNSAIVATAIAGTITTNPVVLGTHNGEGPGVRGGNLGLTGEAPGVYGSSGRGPGVEASGGSQRGAINMHPQAAPAAPKDGDVWVETGTNTLKVRINGVTRTVTLT